MATDTQTNQTTIPPKPTPLSVIFENIPAELKEISHWVLWRYVWLKKKQRWTKPPYRPNEQYSIDPTDPANWSSFEDVKAAYETGDYDGIGFVLSRDQNIICGDLDSCIRDGELQGLAIDALNEIRTYTEISPSGEGLRFVAFGSYNHPRKKDDDKGVEIYSRDRYLTITGQVYDNRNIIEDRSQEINNFAEKVFGPATDEPATDEPRGGNTGKDGGKKIEWTPELEERFYSLRQQLRDRFNITAPDRSSWEFGICCELHKNGFSKSEIFTTMDKMCKSERWQQESETYKNRTIDNAIKAASKPTYKVFNPDMAGSIGVNEEMGGVYTAIPDKKTIEIKPTWISDCAVWIHTETRAEDETEFIFEGIGAKDGRKAKFTMKAVDLADVGKLRGKIINEFGAKNRAGNITFEIIQRISSNTIQKKRVEVPQWMGNTPLVPGIDADGKIEYKLSAKTPAYVYDGDVEAAKNCLRELFGCHRYAPVIISVVLGAPAYARWHPNDRFGVGVWGLTGTLKTTFAQTALSMYGTGYVEDSALLKSGKSGSTMVGSLEVFASAGFLPQIKDNVKTVDTKDVVQYVAEMQAVIEGDDKVRGQKDGGIRASKKFLCTPIITGEIKPDEASTTARIFGIPWSKPDNLDGLTYCQKHVKDMPVIGYTWLKFLESTDLDLVNGFEDARGKKFSEFNSKHYTNPGRLATIYTLLRSTWNLLCESPLGEVFKEYQDRFIEVLDEVSEMQGSTVTSETELSRFISGLRQIMASNPDLLQEGEYRVYHEKKPTIGKRMDNGNVFLLPDPTLAELTKIGVFTQKPSVNSLTTALKDAGILIPGDSEHNQARQRMNGKPVRGWMLRGDAIFEKE